MKALYVAIALWMPDWAENQLCSNVEGKAQDFSQDARMGETAAEASLIVHLGILRNTYLLPDVSQESCRVCRATMLIGLTRRIARHDVDGVETSYRVAARQEVRHNVNLAQLPRFRWMETRILDLCLFLDQAWMSHLCIVQHALNTGRAGQ